MAIVKKSAATRNRRSSVDAQLWGSMADLERFEMGHGRKLVALIT